jgi:two-component system NtrC family response regulator
MPDPESRPNLLVVEDDPSAVRQLRWTFDDYEICTAQDRKEAVAQLRRVSFPVVLLDLGLPPDPLGASEGISTLEEILALAPTTKVIVLTGRSEREHALKAVALGAHDFYRKPIDADEVRLLVQRALELNRLEQENLRLERAASGEPLPGIVARSEAMLEVCRLVERAASSDIGVLFCGESGTGKEVLARALHARSPRSKAPFVAINCAAIPEQLLESELFGHERGAFTGAVKSSVGRLELAQQGTLLLDEIGDMPQPIQAKLLRFLQERTIQRVGGRREIPMDLRVVSASHRDLHALVQTGLFREDLYYRLCELEIAIPPLRERVEDAVLLARHFFEVFRGEADRALQGLTVEAVSAISRHPWPGNVRELENRMKRAVVLAEGSRITARDLDLAAFEYTRAVSLKDAIQQAERGALARAWAETNENVSETARLLGVSRPTVYKLLRQHGLKP